MLSLCPLPYLISFALLLSGCLANPTPHPSQEDYGGLSGVSERDNAAAPSSAAEPESADEGASLGVDDAEGGDAEQPEVNCDDVQTSSDFLALLEDYQRCTTSEECVVLRDASCSCARGLSAASDSVERVEALFATAQAQCGFTEEQLLEAIPASCDVPYFDPLCTAEGRCDVIEGAEACAPPLDSDGGQ